ncbi:unnamed protein product [Nippostrongylus brasiliensis]|uniref:CCHC-type domain-containing protein n=1 Tax=Nippostrongylus brasiliensis TaxID=27835 RepID=A0A0N4XZT8_NIPBR|nr:unnamed protein product [Nippostrongylus brasiliensis]
MSKLLAEDSTAGRLRAMTELRNLTIRPGQDVASFCAVLERLGREANPGCSVEDRSLEYAQILLDNLCTWPEHCQLVAAVHRVDSRKVYEEVKHLAMSIEQSRRMIGAHYKKSVGPTWKIRAEGYQERKEYRSVGPSIGRSNGGGYLREATSAPYRGDRDSETGSTRERNVQNNSVSEARNGTAGNANRKCYNCAKYGHIGRECPRRVAKVNHIVNGRTNNDKADENESLADIIDRVRSLGVRAERGNAPMKDLVGEKMVAGVKVLNKRVEALLDTGSMISIIPIRMLAEAKDDRYNIDALTFVNKSKLAPVHDASGNRMNFLGAVYLDVEVKEGGSSTVAFHISAREEDDVIIGTNALQRLGVEVTVRKPVKDTAANRVVISKRMYVPPRGVQTVQVRCSGELADVDERVIWFSAKGLEAGVYAIRGQSTEVPVVNRSDEPMLLREGEDVGYWGTEKWHDRWEEINPFLMESKNVPGDYMCKERCFDKILLSELQGISFPGAYGRQSFGDLWNAWKIASIFIRTDVSVAQKIQYHKNGVVVLDAGALCSVLRLAYDTCTDWTEFLCTTKRIVTHPAIEENCVIDFYRVALEKLKQELKEESRAARQMKQGPVGFAGPETALLLERDGPRGGLITKVVTTYSGLKETLGNWKTFATWIIVWPMESRGQEEVMKEIINLGRNHLEEGGRIVTAWLPVTAPNEAQWKSMTKLWKILDDALLGFGGENQVIVTASNLVKDNKIFVEVGSPEGAAQFYEAYVGVAAAKLLYSVIRRRAMKFGLPEIERSMRPSTRGRGGVCGASDRPPLKRRAN